MKPAIYRLLRDCTLILLIASALGVTWNWRLLTDAFYGKAPSAAQEPAPSTSTPPLPLGLMQVKEFLDRGEAIIVDARSPETFAKGHIMGARSLPLGETERLFPEFTRTVPKDAMLIVYCNGFGCHDSMELGKKLQQEGYGQVFVYEGGYPEWRDAGYPIAGGER
ncbi:MAG: rhodanese-like domain-containing protein [Geobacter sp.]|nr:rhodanese-like domain-containing protein [Geobacter sp.]